MPNGWKRRLTAPLLFFICGATAAEQQPVAAPAPTVAHEPAVAQAPAAAAAPVQPLVLEQLIARARATHLAQDQTWLTLLHVATGVSGTRSLIDEPRFFVSPHGKRDPAAELEATLAGLLAGDPAHVEDSVAARFPLRLAFLSEHLGFTPEQLPVSGSAELRATLQDFQARQVWLVFPTGYLASPASMFGHTLLLVQGRNTSPLLSQSINYAAEIAAGQAGPLQILKGLTGGFRGYFTSAPYHRKVQEYSDLDQRDIWEYGLNLTPAEIERMMQHAWELRGIGSDYWFFDENCAFNLLYLLEVARPGIHLTDRAGWWVIPVDTLRWVREAGLMGEARYRPSRATRVQAARAGLPAADSDLALGLARGKTTVDQAEIIETDPARRAQAYDLSAEALHALAGRQAIGIADYRARLHAVLAARAALGAQPPLPEPVVPVSPEAGHPSGRLSVGGGRQDGASFGSLAYRAAQHDLLDRPDGYLPGASLTFGELDLRWYTGHAPVVHRLDVVRVTSLSPYEGVFHRLSWTAGGGLRSERMAPDGELHLQGQFDAGVGLTTPVPGGLVWTLATADARAFGIAESYAVGPGAQVGTALGSGMVRLLGTAQVTRYALGWRETAWELAGAVRFAPTTWGAIDLAVNRYARWDRLADGVALRGMIYF